MLSLIIILGLATIACRSRLGEGYENKRTKWVEYMETVELLVKQTVRGSHN